jgi:hypothetical protein
MIFLGIRLPFRASISEFVINELKMLMDDEGIIWDGSFLTFERKSTDMDALVDMVFSDKDNTEVYRITISSEYGIINQQLLEKIIMRELHLSLHDKHLRSLFSMNHAITTDLVASKMRFFNPISNVQEFEAPFQVIGSYCKKDSTWCWSWANDIYDENTHYKQITELQYESIVQNWPEKNLFHTSVLSCEHLFGFAIAHLVVQRMNKKNVLVYPFATGEPDFPAIYLALEVPEDIFRIIESM